MHHTASARPLCRSRESTVVQSGAPAGALHIKVDERTPSSTMLTMPYSLAVDGRIVARAHEARDSAVVRQAWDNLDPATIASANVVRGDRARKEFPDADGDVLAIATCR